MNPIPREARFSVTSSPMYSSVMKKDEVDETIELTEIPTVESGTTLQQMEEGTNPDQQIQKIPTTLNSISAVVASSFSPLSPRNNRKAKENSIVGRVFLIFHRITQSIWSIYRSYIKLPLFLYPYYEKLDSFFQCSQVGSTVETEIFAGLINFFSCLYILAVIPNQMERAGYDQERSAAVISLLTGLGSIGSGLITNAPLVVAPATAVSIYFVSNIQQYFLSLHSANMAVGYAGAVIVFLGIVGPLGRMIAKLIPEYIQIATTIGIGLITALSGYVDIQLVEPGAYTLLTVGKITNKVMIAFSGLILISIGVYYQSKFSYLIGLLWGAFFWWITQDDWPKLFAKSPNLKGDLFTKLHDENAIMLTFELIFLIILTLFGLAKALCDLANIKPTDSSIPKGRLLMIIIGLTNIVSGCLYGPPIILSPESASGIKSGARTGLSAIVTGLFFIFSMFFAPLFTSIPSAATTPILVMIGMILFQNVKSIDFSSKYGMAAFICLTLIPFTDSIIGGLGFGYATYISISLLNGDSKDNLIKFIQFYFPGDDENTSSSPFSSSSLEEKEENRNHDSVETEMEGQGMRQKKNHVVLLSSQHESVPPSSISFEESTGDLTEQHDVRHHLGNITVERARRNTILFLNQITTEVDLQNNEIVRPVL